MHPALWKLIRLSGKASRRSLLRGARTVRGALLLAFVIGGLGIYLVGMVGTTFIAERPARRQFAVRRIGRAYLPLILMAMFLQSVLGSRGMRPSLLQPGRDRLPVRRAVPPPRAAALQVDPEGPGAGRGRPAGLVVADRAGLQRVAVGVRGPDPGDGLPEPRRPGGDPGRADRRRGRPYQDSAGWSLIAVTTLAVVALPQTFSRTAVFRLADVAASFRSTWPGRVLLAPFDVFSNAMLAERWFPDLIGWAGAATAIDLALLLLVLRLDADYLEWSTAISQAMYEQMQRIRRSGGFAIHLPRRNSRFRLPQLPWMGGAGPIAWRQMILTARTSRAMVRMILTLGVLFLVWNWYMFGRSPRASGHARSGHRPDLLLHVLVHHVRSPCPFAGTSIIWTSSRRSRSVPWPSPLASWPDAPSCSTAVQLALLAIYGGLDRNRRLPAAGSGRPGVSLQLAVAGGEQPRCS